MSLSWSSISYSKINHEHDFGHDPTPKEQTFWIYVYRLSPPSAHLCRRSSQFIRRVKHSSFTFRLLLKSSELIDKWIVNWMLLRIYTRRASLHKRRDSSATFMDGTGFWQSLSLRWKQTLSTVTHYASHDQHKHGTKYLFRYSHEIDRCIRMSTAIFNRLNQWRAKEFKGTDKGNHWQTKTLSCSSLHLSFLFLSRECFSFLRLVSFFFLFHFLTTSHGRGDFSF